MCSKIRMYYIEVAIKEKNDEPLTITISKEDMLKGPSELQQSKSNNDHGNDNDNDDSGARKTETSNENKGVTEPLLSNIIDNVTLTPGTNNDVHTQTHARVEDCNAEEIEMSTMNTSVTEKEVMSTILEAVRNLSREDRRHPRITFLDFGGQSMYYAFHQIYLSPKTFYVLVLDMSKNPDEKVNATEDTCGGQFESWTYKGMFMKRVHNIIDLNNIIYCTLSKLYIVSRLLQVLAEIHRQFQ